MTGAAASSFPSQDSLVSMPLVLLAVAVWMLERYVRGGAALRAQFRSCARGLYSLVPELLGLVTCVAVAAGLLYCRQHNGAPIPKEDEEIWESINTEWSLLSTADSLIGLQAMLRMVLLTSAVLRLGDVEEKSAFTDETAAFFFAAALCRTVLLVLSPWDVYGLDGPLGGVLNMACEAAALPMLVCLCRPMLSQGMRRACFLVVATAVASTLAVCNRLALADAGSEYLDVLFSLSRLLEFAGAVAFLAHSCHMGSSNMGCFASFAHAFLPVQQMLGFYFMLTSWNSAPFEEVHELVGAGHPMILLQAVGLAELGLYLTALVVFFVTRTAAKDPEPLQQATAPLFVHV